MIVGLGTDITTISRIATILAKHPDRFEQRCFRDAEVELARERGRQQAATLAGRWAAKEACLKALGAANTTARAAKSETARASRDIDRCRLWVTTDNSLYAPIGLRLEV